MVDRGERVVLEDLSAQVLSEEAILGVVTADAQRGLGQVVGTEAEEVSNFGNLVGNQGGTRQLDHGSDLDVDLGTGRLELFIDGLLNDPTMGLKLDWGEDQRDHDVDLDGLTLLLEHRQDSANNRAGLHVRNLRVEHAKTATTGTEHRVLLVQLLHLGQQTTFLVELTSVSTLVLHLLNLEGLLNEVRQELVKRRVKQPDSDGQALHRGEDTLKVILLHRQDLVDGCLTLLRSVRGDHLVHGRQTISTEEHVLGAAQPDALGTQLASLGSVGGIVGVGLNT